MRHGDPLSTPYQHHTVSPCYCSRQGREVKSIHTREEDLKLSLFADDVITYVENPKELTKKKKKKILELLSYDSMVARCEVNMQKSVTFLHINNKQLEFEIKNTISLILA